MKLKKLVLKKEIVANLGVEEMNSLRGGYAKYSFGFVECVKSYNPLDCPRPYEPRPTVPPTEYTGHTAPPFCCEYGCCETVGC